MEEEIENVLPRYGVRADVRDVELIGGIRRS